MSTVPLTLCAAQFKMVSMRALGKAHKRSTPSLLGVSPNVEYFKEKTHYLSLEKACPKRHFGPFKTYTSTAITATHSPLNPHGSL